MGAYMYMLDKITYINQALPKDGNESIDSSCSYHKTSDVVLKQMLDHDFLCVHSGGIML